VPRRLLAAGLLIAAALAPIAGQSDGATWQPVTAALIEREKPGYGGLCGVLVDHSNGAVIVDLSDRGLYRSADGGKNWEPLGTERINGRTETPGCMMLDPTGKSDRLLLPTVYGGPVALGTKRGDAWKRLNSKAMHVDWCVMDWKSPTPKLVLTLKHESGGVLLRSNDGGQSFTEVGPGYGPAWVFDERTAVAAKVGPNGQPAGGSVRTKAGGATFEPCGDYSPFALPHLHGDTLYWLVEGGLIRSSDQGATWTKVCDLKDGRYGPVFGKSEREMFVLTRTGVLATTDGGKTWAPAIPLPDWKGFSNLTWLDYDPKHDALYAMKMTSDLYRLDHPLPRP
jgi:photosystem II stability/assembly factor-like uncharacterized protein